MDFARRSFHSITRFAGRFPKGMAFIVGAIGLAIWAVTIGLTALIFECVARLDALRASRGDATPLPNRGRWAAAGAIWLATALTASAASGGAPARMIAAVPPTQTEQPAQRPAPSPSTTPPASTSTSVGAPEPVPAPTFGPTGETTEATVVRIVDGDTIVVAIAGKEYKLRYIGMDTPETVDPSSPVQWMGPQATAANEELVSGKTVVLEKDVSETDQYGRLLRYVWLTDGGAWTLVNLELVKLGVASIATYPPDVKYVDLYQAAEDQARTEGVGLWGPEPTAKPTAKPSAKATPKPTPRPTTKASSCHPSYTPCLPIVGDLNCPDVRAMGKAPVTVIGPDDYNLDRDHDGIGCE
jgi:micrococcal nuclease